MDLDDMSARDWGTWFGRRGRDDIALMLLVLWDPIGVSRDPAAADEYEAYADDCLPAIRANDPETLAAILQRIERERMELTAGETDVYVARKVIDGARASAWRWARRTD